MMIFQYYQMLSLRDNNKVTRTAVPSLAESCDTQCLLYRSVPGSPSPLLIIGPIWETV